MAAAAGPGRSLSFLQSSASTKGAEVHDAGQGTLDGIIAPHSDPADNHFFRHRRHFCLSLRSAGG